jgi:hypothetical protein
MADVAMWTDKKAKAAFEAKAKARLEEHPDVWVYFVRLDDQEAAIALPTW